MNYVFRPEFVLVHVAGAHIVVSLRPAWGKRPVVMQIAEVSSRIWEGIQNNTPKDVILKDIVDSLGMSEENAKQNYEGFIRYCKKFDYFLPEDDS